MALTTFPGTFRGYYPFDMRVARRNESPPQFAIAATGDKIAIGGRVWVQGRDTDDDAFFPPEPIFYNLTRVGFKWGSVTKSGGSGMTVSLQDMYTFPDSGYPRPDETKDQTVAVSNGDSSFASNTWYRTGAFGSARQVQHNEKLCVVIEYDAAGRKGSDSVSIVGRAAVSEQLLTPWISRKLSGTWTPESSWPILVLEFADGSFGTLEGSWASNGESLLSFSSNSSPDERGLRFSLPWTCQVDAIVAWMGHSANFDLSLYQDTTVLMEQAYSGANIYTVLDLKEFTFPPVTLSAGVQYTIGLRCETPSPFITELLIDTLHSAAHREVRGQTDLAHVARTNEGAWSTISTSQIPFMGVRICALEA
jgi:hypothetical protein